MFEIFFTDFYLIFFMKFTEKWLYKSEDLFVKKIKKILLIE